MDYLYKKKFLQGEKDTANTQWYRFYFYDFY